MSEKEVKELIKIVSGISSYSFCSGMMYPNDEREKDEVEKYWNQLHELISKIKK